MVIFTVFKRSNPLLIILIWSCDGIVVVDYVVLFLLGVLKKTYSPHRISLYRDEAIFHRVNSYAVITFRNTTSIFYYFPKLFTACLEMIIRDIDLTCGMNISSEILTHLQFADDFVLIAETTSKAAYQTDWAWHPCLSISVIIHQMNSLKTKYLQSKNITQGWIGVGRNEIRSKR